MSGIPLSFVALHRGRDLRYLSPGLAPLSRSRRFVLHRLALGSGAQRFASWFVILVAVKAHCVRYKGLQSFPLSESGLPPNPVLFV